MSLAARAWEGRLEDARRLQSEAIGERSRREQERHQIEVHSLSDREVRAELDRVRDALRETPPRERERVYSRERELGRLDKELVEQNRELEKLTSRIARERKAVDSRSPISRLRWGERAELKRDLSWTERRLAAEQEKVGELKARRERLQRDAEDAAGWERRQEQAAMRATAVTSELRSRQTARLIELDCAPPAHVIKALGERPDGAPARIEWRQAALALEAYRDRYGTVDIERPLAASVEAGSSAQARDGSELGGLMSAVRSLTVARAEGQRPSVAERVCAVADVEKGRAREERHAQERARSTPDYSYDHSYEHHHHRGTHQEPRGISMGR